MSSDAIATFERALQYDTDYRAGSLESRRRVASEWEFSAGLALSMNGAGGVPTARRQRLPSRAGMGRRFRSRPSSSMLSKALGDTIQFVRYLPQVAARGAHVVLACQPALLRLLRTCPGVQTLVAKDRPEMATSAV